MSYSQVTDVLYVVKCGCAGEDHARTEESNKIVVFVGRSLFVTF